MPTIQEQNEKIIGNLPNVLKAYKKVDLASKFTGIRDLPRQMEDFIKSMNAHIANSKDISNNQYLLSCMQDLLFGNKNKLNMKDPESTRQDEREFDTMILKIIQYVNYNGIEDFNNVVKQFYNFYVIAVLNKSPPLLIIPNQIFVEINSLKIQGGSRKRRMSSRRKRRMSSPRKSKKRSSKTTSKRSYAKGKGGGRRKGSKKSKGKKGKSQVKRRSRNNNNRNHGNH